MQIANRTMAISLFTICVKKNTINILILINMATKYDTATYENS